MKKIGGVVFVESLGGNVMVWRWCARVIVKVKVG